MSKEPTDRSQDLDRKLGEKHISQNPRNAEKETSSKKYSEDKRKEVREEHTNHFTNRSSDHNS